MEGLDSMGIKCVKPEGAFYAFPEVEDEDAPQKLLKNGVIVVPGFGFRGEREGSYQDIVCDLGGEFEKSNRNNGASIIGQFKPDVFSLTRRQRHENNSDYGEPTITIRA